MNNVLGNVREFVEGILEVNKVIPRQCLVGAPCITRNFDSTSDKESDEYLTVAQLAQRYPSFTQGSIRWLIYNGDKNGFNKVVRRIGTKIILNLREFRRFIQDSQTANENQSQEPQ